MDFIEGLDQKTRDKLEVRAKLKGSLLLFIRTFFPLLTGREFILSKPQGRESHFITISRALTKCTNLGSNKLVINVPPGHGKSVMVCFWVAWCLAKHPDSNFLYISYSKTLAASHTDTIMRIMSLSQYRNIFNVHLRDDSQAKDLFTTTAGGVVAAFGSSGAITGRNAGLPGLNRFSGAVICFPYDEYVQTEIGAVKIGEIVENELDVKVYSVNLETKEIELKPIAGYYTNPGSEIVEVGLSDGGIIRCTPCHKIWTDTRGWVQAKDLLCSDKLPTPSANSSPVYAKIFPRFAMRDGCVFKNIKLFFRKMLKNITGSFGQDSDSKFAPCFSAPNLVDGANPDTELFGNVFRPLASMSSKANFDSIKSIKFCSRSFFPARKRSVFNRILHVVGLSSIAKVFYSIVSGIPIKVPYFHPFFLFSYERPGNKAVNKKIFNFAGFTQRNSMIAIFNILNGCLKNFFWNRIKFRLPRAFSSAFLNNSFLASDSPMVGNAVNTFVAGDRSPLFVRHIGHVDKTYCINVKDNHNFFAGLCKGALVSNCDDMHKPDEVGSDLIREGVITNYRETIQQRARGVNVPTIFIGQRLHELDLPAYLLSGEDGYNWDRVILKSIDEAGNALYPEAFPLDMLLIRQEKDRYVFASQHQQDPQPAGGGLFLPEDFPILADEPELLATFITADTAETDNMRNDATVFSFWGLYNVKTMGRETDVKALHWLACREIWVEPKNLEHEFMDFWQDCARHKMPPMTAYIEKKSTGVTLISILKGIRGLKIREIERNRSSGSKSQRFIDIQPYIASQLVSLPAHAPHTEKCITHMKKITNNDSHAKDDICDTASDAVRIALIEKLVTSYQAPAREGSTKLKAAAARYRELMAARKKAHKQRV